MSAIDNLVDHTGRPLSSGQVKDALRPKIGTAPLKKLKIHEQVKTCSFEAQRAFNIAQGALLNKIYAKTPQGQIEAVFFYRGCFFTADVDLIERPGTDEVQVAGVSILCPKCDGVLGINDKEIVLHYENYEVQLPDALWRPLISIDGVFGCSYAEEETSGISQAKHVGIKRTACGFMGGIHMGVCYKHRVGEGKSRLS